MLPRIRHCLDGRIKADRSPPTFAAVAKEGSPSTAYVKQHTGSGMKVCQPVQSLHINVGPSSPYLLHPEMHPILIPIESHRFFLGRHLGSRQKTALSTPEQFLPVSNMHHRGRGTSAWAWKSIRRVSRDRNHRSPATFIKTHDEGRLILWSSRPTYFIEQPQHTP